MQGLDCPLSPLQGALHSLPLFQLLVCKVGASAIPCLTFWNSLYVISLTSLQPKNTILYIYFDFFDIKLHFVNYKNSGVIYNYFDSFDIYLHCHNYTTYHMKGSLDIQRFVVCIKFWISLKAWVLGLHLLVLCRGCCTLLFPFGFG